MTLSELEIERRDEQTETARRKFRSLEQAIHDVEYWCLDRNKEACFREAVRILDKARKMFEEGCQE